MTIKYVQDGEEKFMTPEEEAEFRATQPGVGYISAPNEISDRQFFQQLAVMGLITEEEAEAAVSAGTLPSTMNAFIDELPVEERFPARMKLKGATRFFRSDPLVETFGEMEGMTSDQIDNLWRSASLL